MVKGLTARVGLEMTNAIDLWEPLTSKVPMNPSDPGAETIPFGSHTTQHFYFDPEPSLQLAFGESLHMLLCARDPLEHGFGCCLAKIS